MKAHTLLSILIVGIRCAVAEPVPGFALAVMHRGVLVEQRQEGFSDLATLLPITPDTRFNLASVSKQFTAMAVLLLERAGRLSTQDSILRLIPELGSPYEEVRIDDLIHHLSGLPDYIPLCEQAEPIDNAGVARWVKTQARLEFAPGTRFEYSNTGYALLAIVVERASKMPFARFLESRIFAPLGMHRTTAGSEGSALPIARSYGDAPSHPAYQASACESVLGDGGIETDLQDYLRWALALSRGELIPLQEIRTRYFTRGALRSGSAVHYAHGWETASLLGRSAIFHSGAWLGYQSFVAYFPDSELWVAVFSNTTQTDPESLALAAAQRNLAASSQFHLP